MENKEINIKNIRLLDDFNNRVPNGYEQIYLLFAKSLNIFASTLYGCMCHESQDTVEDTFVNLWLSKTQFSTLQSLKGYLYISVRNSYLNYKRHLSHTNKYYETLNTSDFTESIIEAELYSIVDEAVTVLPKEYREVLRKYVEGYKPSEIAKILGKTEQSIYKIKHNSINILRKKLTKDKTFILSIFFH